MSRNKDVVKRKSISLKKNWESKTTEERDKIILSRKNGFIEKYGVDPADYNGRNLDIRLDVQKYRRDKGSELGFDYSELTDERLSDIEQYNIFPNMMFTAQPESALVMRARPHPTDPNKCFWDKYTFKLQPNPEVAHRAGVEFRPSNP